MKLKDFFENLELELNNIDKTKKFMLYFSIVVAISLINYQYFLDGYMQEYQQKESKTQKLNIESKKNFVPTLSLKIKKAKKEQMKLLEHIDALDFELLDMQSKVDSKEGFSLTDELFAQYLNNILKDSKDKDISIEKITIKDDSKKYIGKIYLVKDVKIEGFGSYLNIEKFIRDIEKENILQKIENLTVSADVNSTNFSVEFAIFGDQR